MRLTAVATSAAINIGGKAPREPHRECESFIPPTSHLVDTQISLFSFSLSLQKKYIHTSDVLRMRIDAKCEEAQVAQNESRRGP